MKTLLSSVAAITLIAFAPTANAGTVGEPIIGVFSDPVFAGNLINFPTPGQITFGDLSSLAPPSTFITNGTASSTLQWGTQTLGQPPAPGGFSSLTFTGNTLPASPTTQFQVGTIFFNNGTSAINSLIFGATLSFYLGSVAPANLVGTDNVVINTTSNQFSGTGLTLAQLQTDADYINICGNNSSICGMSIEAFESTQGGVGLTVALLGTVIGDPQLNLTDVMLGPCAVTNTCGSIGDQSPLAETPLPATLPLFASGLAGLGLLGWRRKRKVQAA